MASAPRSPPQHASLPDPAALARLASEMYREFQQAPEASPLRVLEKLTGRRLAA